jgi:hypothetical protein
MRSKASTPYDRAHHHAKRTKLLGKDFDDPQSGRDARASGEERTVAASN